ncbi:MAG TPA: hypothetical protein VN905_11150 [Candidatus Binatia bacterium]|nr:hypothetical protein [Candidatus Binatia bacterium]
MLDELPMTALVEARSMLGDRAIHLRMLLPPYPALGCGILRALRVGEHDDRVEIVAGYEAYERIE